MAAAGRTQYGAGPAEITSIGLDEYVALHLRVSKGELL